jgi:diadenosine tetraphosphate (Ap4A) HIT family hydrolase
MIWMPFVQRQLRKCVKGIMKTRKRKPHKRLNFFKSKKGRLSAAFFYGLLFSMTYDPNNIFAKIIRGEIPSTPVYEDDHVLAFDDISPQMPVHTLVIPKGEYKSLTEFSMLASAEEIVAFHRAVAQILESKGLKDKGYRAICNTGDNGGQEVPHFHMHILGGDTLPPMIKK